MRLCVNMFAFFYFTLLQSNDNIIVWNENKKLEFSNFKGMPPESAGFYLAAASCDIHSEYHLDSNGLKYNIFSFSKKDSSYIKKIDSNLLNHEQFHFNISEIHARYMRKYFSSIKFYNKDSIRFHIYNIINENMAFDSLYDDETSHGADYRMQKQWNIKINKILDYLKEYTEPQGVVILK